MNLGQRERPRHGLGRLVVLRSMVPVSPPARAKHRPRRTWTPEPESLVVPLGRALASAATLSALVRSFTTIRVSRTWSGRKSRWYGLVVLFHVGVADTLSVHLRIDLFLQHAVPHIALHGRVAVVTKPAGLLIERLGLDEALQQLLLLLGL